MQAGLPLQPQSNSANRRAAAPDAEAGGEPICPYRPGKLAGDACRKRAISISSNPSPQDANLWHQPFDNQDPDHQHDRSPSVEFGPLLKQQPSPYGSRAAVVALALALQSGSPAVAQLYCSQRAIVIDAPSNIRTAPTSRAPIACQLRRNGKVILVLPASQRLPATGQAAGSAADWYATMACYRDPQSRAVGLGRPPHYIHRSQVRIKGINPSDWTAPAAPGESNSPTSGGCERLWQPSHQP